MGQQDLPCVGRETETTVHGYGIPGMTSPSPAEAYFSPDNDRADVPVLSGPAGFSEDDARRKKVAGRGDLPDVFHRTSTSASSLCLPSEAVAIISHSPLATAVTTPFSSTVATAVSVLLHVTF